MEGRCSRGHTDNTKGKLLDNTSPKLVQLGGWGGGAELHKFGILVSRIPDISGRKSGHFQINATNLSIFGIKNLQ